MLTNHECYELALQDYAVLLHIQTNQDWMNWSPSDAAVESNAAFHARLCHLMLGHYAQGWPLYEARWHADPELVATQRIHHYPCLLLRDTPIEQRSGKSVFVWIEQGYGDVFQFCRYALQLAKQGVTVLFQSNEALYSLLSYSLTPAGVVILKEGEPTPPFDIHCPMMSLPLALGTDSVQRIPAHTRYLQAPPEQTSAWKQRLLARTSYRSNG